ncbi:hypothetical protein F4779DRAFT_124822 [Xylariaceae sp. FL0662B]|nr:hypothetical protein F4779DRAFT_124822 [Xylariaceae sp. FL0662B]
MSQPQNGRNMDQSSRMGGSVRRARELAEAGVPRGSPPSIPDPPSGMRRPYVLPGLQTKDGQISMAISRPTPVAQWPLNGPMSTAATADSEPYRPPPGRSQPPQRPPRPSRVPSILDGSRIQDHTPVFQYTPQSTRASEQSAVETTATSPSRPSTLSSVGSIPDFPLPVTTPVSSSRKTMNLGPPPSSRRGASSFYSTASFVSPIPEESPKTRSHTSYASSAAIPESFGSISPGFSPNEVSFDDTIAEESVGSDDADESRLVRSASIGKRGKPSLVTTGSSEKRDSIRRPTPKPVQDGPFREGTGYVDASSSSEQVPKKGAVGAAVTTDNMLSAFQGASATDPSSIRKATPSPRPFRLSGLRRPPRLDMDAVRAAEQRGSLTSLPDLILRATRLASLMERGKRPASQFNELDFPEDIYNRDPEKDFSNDPRHQSGGLSDMLAAFPPPASRSGARQSVARQSRISWPLIRRSFRATPEETEQMERAEQAERSLDSEPQKKGRRCCGLPLWGFLFLLFLLFCIIAVAIVVPLEIFVINKPNNNVAAEPDISECEAQLNCANGGTNVLLQGVCSCICSNGFTGIDCTIPTSQGCTTTSISTVDADINNVTIGQAIPRLIRDGQTNFSIPLVATTIQAKFNSANLSCNTENALVTFDGRALAEIQDLSADADLGQVAGVAAAGAPITLTVLPDVTLTVDNPAGTGGFSGSFSITTLTSPTTFSGSTIFATTLTNSDDTEPSATTPPTIAPSKTTTRGSSAATSSITSPTATSSATRPTTTSSTTSSTATPEPTTTFTVTDRIVDFARVAVLFVFQEKALNDASAAQTSLEKFFSNASAGSGKSGMTVEQAMNLSISGGNTIDLVNLFVDVGTGRKGGGPSS